MQTHFHNIKKKSEITNIISNEPFERQILEKKSKDSVKNCLVSFFKFLNKTQKQELEGL